MVALGNRRLAAALRRTPPLSSLLVSASCTRSFRSDAALKALARASEAKTPILILYRYPSFSGAVTALFAHLYHTRLNLPHLILPFSSVIPFRVEDLCTEGLKECHFLNFIGPNGFAIELSNKTSCKVTAFDHRKSVLSKITSCENLDEKIVFNVNLEKSSSIAVYEYYSSKLLEIGSNNEGNMTLVDTKDMDRVLRLLSYIEDGDLCRWSLPDARAFSIGTRDWHSKLNCIINPFMYKQLMEISSSDLIAKGNCYISDRENAAKKLLDKVFKIRLGRGFYGECLGVRADGNTQLSDEIGKELSQMSATAGLRPMGAVIYIERNNLKMCLRSTDCNIDTSEVSKAYGGGGSPSSSSFIIRMDEYNKWISSH